MTSDHCADSEIRQVVRDYLDGMTYVDEAKLRRAFHPDARSIGHYRGTLEWHSLDDFIESCRQAGALAQAQPFFSEIAFIDIAGDAAVAKVVDDYQGSRFTDYLTLLRLPGRWRIVNKAFFDHG